MKGLRLSPALARSASAFAIASILALPTAAGAQNAGASATDAQPTTVAPAVAQPTPAAAADTSDEVVVTGIRASLERSIAIKRDSVGVVDAISSEDIGKFPDTNLAESLQRITGVSVNRVNGEGSTVTVRGFGAQYNLVTLNGRQLAAANITVVGGDQNGDGAGGFDRSFNFSNLASEGVKTLEVYKTGRASIPTGGIGATINVVSRKPLDARETGLTGSIGAKASYDTSADDCVSCGSHVTPEVSGVIGWTNEDQTFGVSLFGSYQKRHFSIPSVANNNWNIVPVSAFMANDGVYTQKNGTTKVTNAPSSGFVAVPDDFRYHFSEDSRERINGQGSVQWKPSDALTITGDVLYARNRESERRSDTSNWFNRPFDQVVFNNNSIPTAVFLHEIEAGSTKDSGAEQAYRAQKSDLKDFGLNAKWDVTDSFSISADAHVSTASSSPDNPNGVSSTAVAISSPILSEYGLDNTTGFPRETISFNDAAKGNNNGKWDVGDLATQQNRQFSSWQHQNLKQGRIDAGWDFGGGSRFDFGGDYRRSNVTQRQYNTIQTLGDWGNAFPRDVEQYAPGLVKEFCTACQFHHYDPKATGAALVGFRAQDATKLYNALFDAYQKLGHNLRVDANTNNRVRETIAAVYGQFTWAGQFGDHDARMVAGVRYERTRVNSVSLQTIPTALVWQADNDFTIFQSADQQPVSAKGKYNNLLPSLDFQINIRPDLVGRFSFSRTISRPNYGNLFASTTATPLGRPSVLGGTAGGFRNDANLQPLISDNFDVSLEWYFKPGSYLSGGFFEKRVRNFIGNSVIAQNLFGLRDPTSGKPGTRSGTALASLTANGYNLSDVNLFTLTALLQQHNGDIGAAQAEFNQNFDATKGALNQAFVDKTLAAVDIVSDSSDPLATFNVNTPINNKDAKIWGFELAGTYFLGNTGFGVAASYTLVRGDVHADINADPTANQFALIGLSDTYNITAIYDKHGISARLAYNYRKKFLSELNRGGSHNPIFTAPYGTLDFNVSYDITPNLAVSLEGINLTEEGVKTYARDKAQTYFIQEGSARYLLGVRYKF